MSGSNSLVLTLVQKEGGEELSTLTLSYPSLENAVANATQIRLILALLGGTFDLAEEKAVLTGEGEVFGLAVSKLRELLGKNPINMVVDKLADMPRGVLR